MIESISISNIATYNCYTPEILTGLSQFNYIYGSNGTGKTTISRIIEGENRFPSCTVTWKNGTKLQPFVYNYDFIERNFLQSTELKGVFTLGAQQADTLKKIATIKTEIDTITKKSGYLNETMQGIDGTGGKKAELVSHEAEFKKKCWEKKVKYDPDFQVAFEGFRNSSDKFQNKILQEVVYNTATLLTFVELKNKAASIYAKSPVLETTLSELNFTYLINHETNTILSKVVIGKEDVDIAKLINKLGNSDWLRNGRTYYDTNLKVCPFCQQITSDEFAQSLEEYFDETYLNDMNTIDRLALNYDSDSKKLQLAIETIINTPSRFLEIEKLKPEKELFDSIIMVNKQRLAEKKKEASKVVTLEPINHVASTIQKLFADANIKIKEHNKIVANLKTEKDILTKQIWRFVIEELNSELKTFNGKKEALQKAIAGIESQLAALAGEIRQKNNELQLLEKQTTSVQPTIDGINNILKKFGFNSFKLAKALNGTSYKLLRNDGTDAKTTLSEGEKTFITFLYFYHLLKGSNTESGITTDRIVVFDDPVSSLDSDILFIVSNLIKGLFDEVRSKKGQIKQIFILTHNVYFHKEITYNPNRSDCAMKEETFWVVRKIENQTKIEKHTSNPVRTSYDLLWSEVRNPNRCCFTIQNILRRILENYFKIHGGIDSNKICDLFDGKEKIICKSLFSWVNDGSHYAHDDLYITIDDSQVENFLRVFKEVFEKTDHMAHYNMMMGIVVNPTEKEPENTTDLSAGS